MPRALLPVAQTPLVCYAVAWLAQSGVANASICCNRDSLPVRAVLGDGAQHSMALDYVEDATPRGPAGCLRDAAQRTEARTLVVIDGTIVPSVELSAVLETHAAAKAAVTIVAHQTRPAQGRPWDPLLSGGIYLVERRVCEHVPCVGFHDIKEGLIPQLHRAGERIVTHMAPGAKPQVLNAGTYLAVNHWMVERVVQRTREASGHPGRNEAMAHVTAAVADDARLVGPVLIGPGVRVRRGAAIIGPAAIGAGCEIDEGAVVSRSVTWSGCQVGRGAIVDNSILADEAVVLPGEGVFGALLVSGRLPHHLAEESAMTGPRHTGAAARPPHETPAEPAPARFLHQYTPVPLQRSARPEDVEATLPVRTWSRAAGEI